MSSCQRQTRRPTPRAFYISDGKEWNVLIIWYSKPVKVHQLEPWETIVWHWCTTVFVSIVMSGLSGELFWLLLGFHSGPQPCSVGGWRLLLQHLPLPSPCCHRTLGCRGLPIPTSLQASQPTTSVWIWPWVCSDLAGLWQQYLIDFGLDWQYLDIFTEIDIAMLDLLDSVRHLHQTRGRAEY